VASSYFEGLSRAESEPTPHGEPSVGSARFEQSGIGRCYRIGERPGATVRPSSTWAAASARATNEQVKLVFRPRRRLPRMADTSVAHMTYWGDYDGAEPARGSRERPGPE
jgi:hypothetical protein